MFKSLKEYIKLKTGIKQNSEELKMLARKLDSRYDFLSAFMNLTWPERLELDPPVLAKTLQRLQDEQGVSGFNSAIHKNDLMFAFHVNRHKHDFVEALHSYFRVGAETAFNLRSILSEEALAPNKILDFGSGYGRVSRFLPKAFPKAEIEISEVKEHAMRFQEAEFGFKTIVHNQEVESFPARKYDLILALSIFTHLPKKSFDAWLKKLSESLTEGGALVFTFHDVAQREALAAMERLQIKPSEFVYTDRSEDRHFSFVADSIKNHEEYGSAFFDKEFLQKHLEKTFSKVKFLERKLVRAQDAVLVVK